MAVRFRRWSGNASWTWPTRASGPATSPGSSGSATAASARSWGGECFTPLPAVLWPVYLFRTLCWHEIWLEFSFFFLTQWLGPSATMRQAASSLASLVAPSRKWLPRKSWRRSQSTRGRIPPCLRGKSETGCWQRVCVMGTQCPVWAPLTGEKTGQINALFVNHSKVLLKVEWFFCFRIIRTKVQQPFNLPLDGKGLSPGQTLSKSAYKHTVKVWRHLHHPTFS